MGRFGFIIFIAFERVKHTSVNFIYLWIQMSSRVVLGAVGYTTKLSQHDYMCMAGHRCDNVFLQMRGEMSRNEEYPDGQIRPSDSSLART